MAQREVGRRFGPHVIFRLWVVGGRGGRMDEARREVLRRRFALEVIMPTFGAETGLLERFELKAWESFPPPTARIVHVHDFDGEDRLREQVWR